jgi:hypothetical protein
VRLFFTDNFVCDCNKFGQDVVETAVKRATPEDIQKALQGAVGRDNASLMQLYNVCSRKLRPGCGLCLKSGKFKDAVAKVSKDPDGPP